MSVHVVGQEARVSGSEMDEDMDDQYYMRRLEAGLFTLQLVDYIMLDICHSCHSVSNSSCLMYVTPVTL